MKNKNEPFSLETGEIFTEPTYMQQTYIRANGSKGVRTINTYPSQTDRSFQESCDVNNIVRRYEQTGQMPHVTRAVGQYMDSTDFGDYAESLQRVLNANDAFMHLPATVRDRFANDPAKLIEFMADPNNYDEGVKLGLVAEKPKQTQEIKRDQRESKPANENKKSDTSQNTQTDRE